MTSAPQVKKPKRVIASYDNSGEKRADKELVELCRSWVSLELFRGLCATEKVLSTAGTENVGGAQ
jgi:hypothetical protein